MPLIPYYIYGKLTMVQKPGKLFIIIGPSGVGKTSLINAMLLPSTNLTTLQRVITYTSRPARMGEVHAKDYFFVSEHEFKSLLERDFFMEHSVAYGTYYGSPKALVQCIEQGDSFIMAVDIKGAQDIKKCHPEAILIGIYVDEIDALKSRLKHRLTENEAEIERRIGLATQEMEFITKNSACFYRILNKDFEKSVKNLKEIIESELSL